MQNQLYYEQHGEMLRNLLLDQQSEILNEMRSYCDSMSQEMKILKKEHKIEIEKLNAKMLPWNREMSF